MRKTVNKKALWAIVAAGIVLGALWATSHSVSPKTATQADVLAEAKKGGYRIISTQQLWERYKEDRESLLLVDTRQDWEYRTGHIKGALCFPMEPTWLSRWQKRGALRAFLGDDKNRLVVFY